MMRENDHQIALRRWIYAGLNIAEVAALNGDAKYIFNNMIAKYTLASDEYGISEFALSKLKKTKVDLRRFHKRSKFYGKDKPYMYEHTVPATVVRDALLNSDHKERSVADILQLSGSVILIMRSENEILRERKLNSCMPEGWSFGDDTDARYKEAGIFISNEKLKVTGAIYR